MQFYFVLQLAAQSKHLREKDLSNGRMPLEPMGNLQSIQAQGCISSQWNACGILRAAMIQLMFNWLAQLRPQFLEKKKREKKIEKSGHDESDTAENRGNFLEELNFLAKYHQPLQKWIQQHPQNVSYFSPNTQNEMISVLSQVVTERIKGEVAYSKHFSIECDEVTSHKRAFMSVIVRYVYDFSIWERCIKLERVDSIKGKNLAEIIIAILEDMKFPIANLVGKGFDGASNMSGKDEGVQQHLTAAGATKSIYFHCFAHRLNLILEKGVSTVPAVQDVFDTIGSIYRYLEGSPKRHALYERKLREKGITKGKIALHSLSDTRWAAKSDNLDTVVNTMPAIIEMLKEMSIEGESAAEGLLVRMQKFKFILACFILKKCFALCKSVSEYLQFKEMDLVSAVSGIQSLKRALQDLRNDAKMEEFVQEADNYCQVSHLKVTNFEEEGISKRKRTIPAHFRDGSEILYGESSAVQEDQPDPSVYQKNRFRRDLYFPFLDRLISELDRRFSSQACEILLQASTFHPTKLMEDNVGKVKQIAAFYGVDSERVCSQFTLFSKSTEVALWKKEYGDYLKEKERAEKDKSIQMPQTWLCLPTLLKIFAKNGLSNLFPDLFEVVKIIATLPATVASCERAHSKVKIINTYLRASMSDQRLEHLIKISIERDIAENIELDSLLELFKTSGNRKLAL
eukprot:gene9282-10262_t